LNFVKDDSVFHKSIDKYIALFWNLVEIRCIELAGTDRSESCLLYIIFT